MGVIKKILYRLTVPFVAHDWYLNVLIKVPQVVVGAILAFHYGPRSFGMPWSPKELELSLFEVSQRFLEVASNFYEPFGQYPYALGLFAGIIKCFGGFLFIFGLGVRFISICLLVLMSILLANSHAFDFNYIYPLFFISVSCYALYFGSGKFGIDHLLTSKSEYVNVEFDDFE